MATTHSDQFDNYLRLHSGKNICNYANYVSCIWFKTNQNHLFVKKWTRTLIQLLVARVHVECLVINHSVAQNDPQVNKKKDALLSTITSQYQLYTSKNIMSKCRITQKATNKAAHKVTPIYGVSRSTSVTDCRSVYQWKGEQILSHPDHRKQKVIMELAKVSTPDWWPDTYVPARSGDEPRAQDSPPPSLLPSASRSSELFSPDIAKAKRQTNPSIKIASI